MKILKIELQNINSLKSDAPIIIDFETEEFRDIGLYAITGPTGAGKTTILDAITIAIYHSTPRYNGTVKEAVLSYGANEAFSRVLFENDGTIYEAFWSLRVVNKSGKIIKPKEEVSLKNISDNIILASKKTDITNEIKRITQLDYKQFLRSVMLAQGDFAAFLVAGSKEKGELLQQITGEDIYIKIGQAILDRKNTENNKLKDLELKINAEDVLSEERKLELNEEEKVLHSQVEIINNEISHCNRIDNWYKTYKKEEAKTKDLESREEQLNKDKEKYSYQLTQLQKDEAASPFRKLIEELHRNESSLETKTQEEISCKEILEKIKPEKQELAATLEDKNAQLSDLNVGFRKWNKIFEKIVQLDTELYNKNENLKRLGSEKNENQTRLNQTNTDIQITTKELQENELKIKQIKDWLEENSFLKEVNAQLTAWIKTLTVLNGKKADAVDSKKELHRLDNLIKKDQSNLKITTKTLNQKQEQFLEKKSEIKETTTALSKENLNHLMDENTSLNEKINKYEKLKDLSIKKSQKEKQQAELNEKKEKSSAEIFRIETELETLLKEIITQEKSVEDAKKILELQNSIANYENDRKKLKKGNSCPLCGSKEHPYVSDYLEQIPITKAEEDLKIRTTKLDRLKDLKINGEQEIIKLKSGNGSYHDQILTIGKELKNIEEEVNSLQLDIPIDKINEIDLQIISLRKQYNDLTVRVSDVKKLELKHTNLQKEYNALQEEISIGKADAARLDGEINNYQKQYIATETKVNTIAEDIHQITSEFNEQLHPFKYTIPDPNETDSFIAKLEKDVLDFKRGQEALQKKESKHGELKTSLEHNNKSLKDYKIQIEAHKKKIEDCKKEIETLKIQRAKYLPLEISVEEKRESLQEEIDNLQLLVDTHEQKLHALNDKLITQETLAQRLNEDIQIIHSNLTEKQEELNHQLASSEFKSRDAIEDALLSDNLRMEYKKYKENLTAEQQELEALKLDRDKNFESLLKEKDFEIEEDANLVLVDELNQKKSSYIERVGEIKQTFKKDQEIEERNSIVFNEIKSQKYICATWENLYKVCGNSVEGFNKYVQRLTLEHLLNLANVHLYKLNKRYSLKMSPEVKASYELKFDLIDHYQTDQARSINSSSGGEKFIISLALALGLSDLASNNVKIDSLFIDEGFGTLDSNTLETVISTLETLQSQGKQIGIISHVENLKERIPRQIKIQKKSNGVSTVKIV